MARTAGTDRMDRMAGTDRMDRMDRTAGTDRMDRMAAMLQYWSSRRLSLIHN